MSGRVTLIVLVVLTTLGHLAFDLHRLYQKSLGVESGGYELTGQRLADRVVLIIIDSWAARTMNDASKMPRLFQRQADGAAGILWAPRQTGTVQGILTLATGVPPEGLAAVGLVSTSRFAGWTIFDDVVARGERVSFHGGPMWATLFGDRATGSFRTTGHGPHFREDDLEGLAHSERALLAEGAPTLSVVHISETDMAAHQYGTESQEYLDVLSHWDLRLDEYLQGILRDGTTVIITSDHGNDRNGSHGGSEPIYRRVPVIMLGSGIARGARIEMGASDMPSTLALLLGVRAPGRAVGVPAVDALRLSPAERAQALLIAYARGLAVNPHLIQQPRLIERLLSAMPTRQDDLAFSWITTAQAKEYIPKLQTAFREFQDVAIQSRESYSPDWLFVCATFALATMLLFSVLQGDGDQSGRRTGLITAWCSIMVVAEVVFCIRIIYASQIKSAYKNNGGQFLLLSIVLLAILVMAGIRGMSNKQQMLGVWRRNQPIVVVTAYLSTTILYPVNMVGLAIAPLVAVWLLGSSRSSAAHLISLLLVLIYLTLGTKLWFLLGESSLRRYAVGIPVTILAVVALAWLDRRYAEPVTEVRRLQLLGIGVGLIMLPFSAIDLSALGSFEVRLLASVLATAFVLIAFRLWRLNFLLVVSCLVPTVWFWWWGRLYEWALYAALVAGALPLVRAWRLPGSESSSYQAMLVALLCLLLTLTAPRHVASLLGFVVLLLAFFGWTPKRRQAEVAIALAAVVLVSTRYGLFELYGNADSPLQGYSLKHLDLTVAYLGDSSRSLIAATLMVVLKIFLASALVLSAPLIHAHWRAHFDSIIATMVVFVSFQIGQSALRAALAFEELAYQYDFAVFSIMVHTGVLVSYVIVTWFYQWGATSRRSGEVRPAN